MATSRVTVSFEGMSTLKINLERVIDAVKAAVAEAVLEGAEIVAEAARAKAPVDSGDLRSGIKADMTWDRNAPVAWAGAGFDKDMNNKFVKYSKTGKRYYYPTAVEYGHGGPHPAPARPFMRPAADESRSKVRAVVKARISQAVGRAGR